MTVQSTVAVYETLAQAEDAVRQLAQSNYPIRQVSIVARDLEKVKAVRGFIGTADVAKSAAGTGARYGGLFGFLLGAGLLFVPGVGPVIVAESLAALVVGTVEGAAFGAAGGGVLGALNGWWISRKRIIKYRNYVKGGKYLMIAQGSDEEVMRAQEILARGSVELNLRAEASPAISAG